MYHVSPGPVPTVVMPPADPYGPLGSILGPFVPGPTRCGVAPVPRAGQVAQLHDALQSLEKALAAHADRLKPVLLPEGNAAATALPPGTSPIAELVDEVRRQAAWVEALTGRLDI